jgi:plasmid maintenance system antidote protein VapI
MLTQEELREELRDRHLKMVADGTGLHRNTIYNFIKGSHITARTAEKLYNYIERNRKNGQDNNDI